MIKKVITIVILSIIFLTGCSTYNTPGTSNRTGIEINNVSSSIGTVGTNINDFDTQSFKYAITLENNEDKDIMVLSIHPVLSSNFLERVLNKDTEVKVNKTISKGGSLTVTGEIIFNAKGLTKEQIISLQPFVKDIRVLEERTINKSF